MSEANLKEEIRVRARKQRAGLSKEYRQNADSLIAEKFIKFLDSILDIKSVGLYWSNEYEIDTRSILESLYQKKYTCALPIVMEDGMHFCIWTPTTIMKPNANLKFVEPIGTKEIMPDLIVVPLLTCDKNGNRIGSGKGWYDRYLANHKSIKVGLCYSKMLSKSLPQQKHDIKLYKVITESEIF